MGLVLCTWQRHNEIVKDLVKLDQGLCRLKGKGNKTPLHFAATKGRVEVIELLLGAATTNSGILELNAINICGLTGLDLLLIFPSEAGDTEIMEMLRAAGALRANDIIHSSIPSYQSVTVPSTFSTPEMHQISESKNLVDYFKFKKGRDSPSDVRSVLLVIAVLFATATFQVGVNPPGGAWQDDYIPDQSNSPGAGTSKPHFAGKSILASSAPNAYEIVVVCNSIGLSVSLSMINILTSGFPLHFELIICTIAIYFTYNTALVNMAPKEVELFVILTTAILSSLLPFLIKDLRELVMDVPKSVVGIAHCVIRTLNQYSIKRAT